MTHAEFVTVVRLLRPQGRKGELLADLLTGFPEQLSSTAGVFLVPAAAGAPLQADVRTVVESHWMPTGRNAGRIVVKLTGCDSIAEAEKLAGFQLMLPAAERPALAPGTFYISDLIGCTLYNGNQIAGEVIDVEFAMSPHGRTRLEDAPPLLSVQLASTPSDMEPVLIPFVQAQLQAVDIPARRIIMNLPEGLLEPQT